MGRKKKEYLEQPTIDEVDAKTQAEVNEFFEEKGQPSIDRPPFEAKEGNGRYKKRRQKDVQITLIKPSADDEQQVQELFADNPQSFKFKMLLVLQPKDGDQQPYSIPIAAGTAPSERVEEYLEKRFTSNRFRSILRGVLGKQPLRVEPPSDCPIKIDMEKQNELDSEVLSVTPIVEIQ